MNKQAVLSIYYKDKFGNLRHEPQGKFFYDENQRAVFLADMTENKVFRFCNGYAISKQILEAFSELGIRPRIVYRRLDLNQTYTATPTDFKTLGIFGNWANHDQYVLPIRADYWDVKEGNIEYEPKDFPKMDLADWKKTTFVPTERTVGMDTRFSVPQNVKAEIRRRMGDNFPVSAVSR